MYNKRLFYLLLRSLRSLNGNVMAVGRNLLHYAKLVGFIAIIVMIWLSARQPAGVPRFASGQPKITGAFVNGQAEGTWTWWYQNGNKMTEGNFIAGKRNGLWMTWHEDGSKKSESIYENDQLNGLCIQWYPNGQVKQTGMYISDKRNGVHFYYDTSGRLVETREFDRGTLVKKQ